MSFGVGEGAIAVHDDAEWRALCQAMGNPPWSQAPAFSTALGRKQNEDELEALITAWTSHLSTEEVVAQLRASGVECGIVRDGRDLLNDPQLKSRGAFQEVKGHREIESYLFRPPPLKFSKIQSVAKPAPTLGENTFQICTELLGIPEDEVAQLVIERVIEI